MRRRISIRGCVCPSVRPSVGPSVGPSPVIFKRILGASCAVYPALLESTLVVDLIPGAVVRTQSRTQTEFQPQTQDSITQTGAWRLTSSVELARVDGDSGNIVI